MKMNSLKAAAAIGLSVLLANTAAAQDARSKPVGYETLNLAPGQFNAIGLRLVNPAVGSGTFSASTATSLTADADLPTLDAATTYEVQLESGASFTALGSSFSGTEITGLDGITADFQEDFTIRAARTIADVFGANNEGGLAASANADPSEADIVFIPQAGGSFQQVFFSTFTDDPAFTGWLDASTFAQADTAVIETSSGVFVQTKQSAEPINLVVTGSVKTTDTAFVANDAFNLISGVYPAGATLENSGLSNAIQGSANADPSEADLVQLPDGAGGFTVAFFSTFTDDPAFTGWLNASTFAQIPGEELTSSFFIQRRGPEITGLLTAPPFYADL